MCQFLCSVRIAEHTVPTVMVEKFVKSMEELKEVLSRFGSALVKMEHVGFTLYSLSKSVQLDD